MIERVVLANDEEGDNDPESAYYINPELKASLKKENGKINTSEILKLIGRRWKSVSNATLSRLQTLVAEDTVRYEKEMAAYLEKNPAAATESKKRAQSAKAVPNKRPKTVANDHSAAVGSASTVVITSKIVTTSKEGEPTPMAVEPSVTSKSKSSAAIANEAARKPGSESSSEPPDSTRPFSNCGGETGNGIINGERNRDCRRTQARAGKGASIGQ